MPPTFFTDRNLGKQFPAILAENGLAVERHEDHFAHDTPDVEWIRHVARRGWIALSHDKSIRRRPNERAAVLENRLRLIVFIGKLPFPDIARFFARTRRPVERFIDRNDAPWIARFYVPSPAERARKRDPMGRIELWLDDRDA